MWIATNAPLTVREPLQTSSVFAPDPVGATSPWQGWGLGGLSGFLQPAAFCGSMAIGDEQDGLALSASLPQVCLGQHPGVVLSEGGRMPHRIIEDGGCCRQV